MRRTPRPMSPTTCHSPTWTLRMKARRQTGSTSFTSLATPSLDRLDAGRLDDFSDELFLPLDVVGELFRRHAFGFHADARELALDGGVRNRLQRFLVDPLHQRRRHIG